MTKMDNIPVNETNMKDKANALYELETTDPERWESIKQECANNDSFVFYYRTWPQISQTLLVGGMILAIVGIVLMVLDKRQEQQRSSAVVVVVVKEEKKKKERSEHITNEYKN